MHHACHASVFDQAHYATAIQISPWTIQARLGDTARVTSEERFDDQ